MSKINSTFLKLGKERRKALIPFITAGDPAPHATVPIMHALVEAGADIIELGVPFSDPMADGPVIQRSSERAIKQGVGLNDVLAYVKEFRRFNQTTPVVLMGYANPIEQMGTNSFAERAQASEVDGVLIVDYPPEESGEFRDAMETVAIDTIYLLSPTSDRARIKMVAEAARGYIYYVSLKGVTGSANLDLHETEAAIAQIKVHTDLPVGVGFGIRDGETAKRIAKFADAVIIGSRIIQEIENGSPSQAAERVQLLVKNFREAMDK